MIEAGEISSLVPHAGDMSLIERVISFDDKQIVCETSTHLDPANPLRAWQRLSAINAIEYGAQAMALHGALTGGDNDNSCLVAARNVEIQIDYLDQLESYIRVCAELQMKDVNAAVYRFSVAHGEDVIAAGRLTIAYGQGANS